MEALSDFDWQLLIRTLHAAQRWDQLWDLMRRAPAVWGVRIVIQLAGSGWVPNDPLRRRIYDGVLPSARAYEAAAFRGPGDYWQPSSMSELLKPIAEINPLEIENLRQPRTSHAERALAEFAVALARWHRAHDVALEDAAAGAPLAGDIEVESGE